jgi:hypothetical protein
LETVSWERRKFRSAKFVFSGGARGAWLSGNEESARREGKITGQFSHAAFASVVSAEAEFGMNGFWNADPEALGGRDSRPRFPLDGVRIRKSSLATAFLWRAERLFLESLPF